MEIRQSDTNHIIVTIVTQSYILVLLLNLIRLYEMGDRDFIVEMIASLFNYMKQIRYTKEETMTAISCSNSKKQKLDKNKNAV